MTRLLSGVAMAASAFALVWFLPTQGLLVVALVIATLAFFEYAALARGVGAPVPVAASLVTTLAACAITSNPIAYVSYTVPVCGLGLIAVAITAMATREPGVPLVHSAMAGMLAPLYIGLPLGALVAIHAAAGREGVLVLIATVAASDTFQYYSGRTFGRRPLAPVLSPKKTIEGALGGFVLAPLALVAMAYWWLPRVPPLAAWGVGAGMVVAGIAGDLFESAMKRAAGVKDSAHLIPGHGGVLDRIDALLFCAPIFYVLVTLT
jgi:phosphatidate cytidylyltransferase